MPGLRSWRAFAALACGHLAALAVTAAAVLFQLPLGRPALQWGAGLLLAAALACHLRQGPGWTGQAGMALWGFISATAHGAGLLLMPALMSLCGSGASAPLMQILSAMGLHMAAMLAANGAAFYLAARLLQMLKA